VTSVTPSEVLFTGSQGATEGVGSHVGISDCKSSVCGAELSTNVGVDADSEMAGKGASTTACTVSSTGEDILDVESITKQM
jgi:hypothetical protein